MSTQSILTKTANSIRSSAEKQLSKQANNYILNKKYLLGKGHNRDRARHAIKILSFICSENCELIDSINKSIEGEDIVLDNHYDHSQQTYDSRPKHIAPKQQDVLYQLWLSQGNAGTINDFLEIILDNDRVEWSGELKW